MSSCRPNFHVGSHVKSLLHAYLVTQRNSNVRRRFFVLFINCLYFSPSTSFKTLDFLLTRLTPSFSSSNEHQVHILDIYIHLKIETINLNDKCYQYYLYYPFEFQEIHLNIFYCEFQLKILTLFEIVIQ